MSEGGPTVLSATSKRMLGIRDFEPIPLDTKAKLLGSNERIMALQAVDTTTMPRGPVREMKRSIVLEILKQGLLSTEVLRNNPMVYIGSGTDVEYPLALGGRHIIMVDPVFEQQQAIQEVIDRIEHLIAKGMEKDRNRLTFDFDFGEGSEQVVVELVPSAYDADLGSEGYALPDAIGHLVLYASQGPTGAVSISQEMKSKIVENGAIIQEADITKIARNRQEERISLGKSHL
ncbi:MAG: hypothetical protein V4480_02635 [Patescibacteria group bacterium]